MSDLFAFINWTYRTKLVCALPFLIRLLLIFTSFFFFSCQSVPVLFFSLSTLFLLPFCLSVLLLLLYSQFSFSFSIFSSLFLFNVFPFVIPLSACIPHPFFSLCFSNLSLLFQSFLSKQALDQSILMGLDGSLFSLPPTFCSSVLPHCSEIKGLFLSPDTL